jgi:flagellar protein FliO/FliZ
LPSLLLHARRRIQLSLASTFALVLITWFRAADAVAAGTTPGTTPGKGEATPLDLPTTTTSGSSGDGSSGGLARTIVGLLVVIAVIYGVTWVLKQVKSSREEDAHGDGLADSASLPLGPGRAVHLVRAGNEYLLLGVTEGGIQPLRTYSEAEARAAGLPIESTEIDEFRPVPEPKGQGPVAIVERLRDLTVRR